MRALRTLSRHGYRVKGLRLARCANCDREYLDHRLKRGMPSACCSNQCAIAHRRKLSAQRTRKYRERKGRGEAVG